MVVGIWGQTRNLEDRTFDPADLTKRRSGGPSRLWRPDMGTDTMSGIPDMGTDTVSGIPKQEGSTHNVQLSTFNGVTERGHGGRDVGTDTEFGRPNLLTRWACPSAGRTVQAGCSAQIWGQTRCLVPDMGTDTVSGIPIRNVQRETFNSQLSTG
jgi:hypothetical protein